MTASLETLAHLRGCKDDLLARWRKRVLEDPGVPQADRLPQPLLDDHIPEFVDHLIACLSDRLCTAADRARRLEHDDVSRRHARQRHRQGYTLEAALREWAHFRAALIEAWHEVGVVISRDDRLLVNAAIDEAMARAAMEMQRSANASLESHLAEQKTLATQLAAEIETRKRFGGVLGHDLRTPLGAIALGAEAVLQQGGLSTGQAKTLRGIVASAERMGRLIDDLLDLTRVQAGGAFKIDRKPSDLATICTSVLDEFRLAQPERLFELTTVGDTRGAWDADRLEQLASNLLQNAVVHGDPTTRVRVALRGEPERVVLVVTNDGPAIPRDLHDTMFDPFASGGTPASGGLGLGLFIVRQIAQAHGGEVAFESEAGRPTRFSVTLPRAG